MNFSNLLKKAAPDALVVLAFLLVSMFYFLKPFSEDLVLGGHDLSLIHI